MIVDLGRLHSLKVIGSYIGLAMFDIEELHIGQEYIAELSQCYLPNEFPVISAMYTALASLIHQRSMVQTINLVLFFPCKTYMCMCMHIHTSPLHLHTHTVLQPYILVIEYFKCPCCACLIDYLGELCPYSRCRRHYKGYYCVIRTLCNGYIFSCAPPCSQMFAA